MKKYTHIIIALMFIPMSAYAGGAMLMQIGGGVADVGGGYCLSSGDLYTQTFDGTGYAVNGAWGDEAESISGASAVLDEDYSDTTICGSQALRAYCFDQYDNAYYQTIPNATISTYYFRGYIKVVSEDLDDGEVSPLFLFSDGTRLQHVRLAQTSGQLNVYFWYVDSTFSNVASTAHNISTGQWYRIEIYWNNSGTEAWELRVDGATIDGAQETLHGDISAAGYLQVGIDPDNAVTGTTEVLFKGIDVSSTGWLGQ